MTRPLTQEHDRRLVAVMFTDMVGYTALFGVDERLALEKRGQYREVVERHHASRGGTIVQYLGDGTMGMFPSALAAVEAAVEMQRELAPQDVPVRIGIHVGEVVVESHGLVGDAVNVAARIESFAVSGGVMLSDSAHEQIKNRTDVEVTALGRFRLKNVGRPFELFAVSAEGIAVPERSALEGKGERFASLPSNLPEPSTSFIARGAELESLVALAREHRVLTITGPGGIGKTRILIEIGRALSPEFLDGVAFVTLADVSAPDGFVPTLAAALDVKEADGRTMGEGIVALVGDSRALLLLDNFEHIVAAAPEVARLAKACPELRIVTTSRTPLRIHGEREYALAALAAPTQVAADVAESLLDYPAVALFVERAAAAKGSFALTPENAGAVAAICRRLDGLPLAIELAAARLRLMSPEVLSERLDHALSILTSGARDAPERQQTLRGAIGWSHDLLTDSEKRLFRRMAVFVGGCTLADVEAICAGSGESAIDEIESLVDKALVQVDGQTDRLAMLQTIGEYARERLDEANEADETALRHAHRYAALAREVRDGIEGTDQVASLERGLAEEGNIQAVLETLLARARVADPDAREAGLQLCGDLWLYWHVRGKHLTARHYSSSFLELGADGASVGRAGALQTAGLASWTLGQFERANEEWGDGYRMAGELGAGRESCIAGLCWGLGLLGFDLEAGLVLTNAAIERGRALGFVWAEGFASTIDGILHSVAGNLESARARYSSGLELQRGIGDREGAGLSLGGLAGLAAARGDLTEAIELYEGSLASFEAIGDRAEEARILAEIGWTQLRDGDADGARLSFHRSVRAYTDVASVRGIGLSLIGLAAAASVEGDYRRAVQISAAAEVYASQEGIVNVYSDDNPGRDFIDRAKASLADEDVARATEMGRRLTISQALDLTRTAEA